MRNGATWFVAAVLTLALAAQFTGCEKYVLPDISISPDTLRFGPAADSQFVHLTTNVVTSVEQGTLLWAEVYPQWFDEDATVTISIGANTGRDSRTGVITFKSEALQKELVIIQEAPAED